MALRVSEAGWVYIANWLYTLCGLGRQEEGQFSVEFPGPCEQARAAGRPAAAATWSAFSLRARSDEIPRDGSNRCRSHLPHHELEFVPQ